MKTKVVSFFIALTMLASCVAINTVAEPDTTKQILINEICSGNGGTNGNLIDLVDSDNKYCDWIELYNPSDNSIDISNYGISDNASKPFKTTIAQNTIIKAKDFLVVYCSKTAVDDTKIIAGINLSGDGESIFLTDVQSECVDYVNFPALAKDTVYSRIPDGSETLKTVLPTPGTTNSEAETIPDVTAPTFSHAAGMYSQAFTLTIASDSDCTIYYTTDGSDPRISSTKKIYSTGITVKDITGQKNVLSNKISSESIGKSNVIRAVAKNTDGEFSSITSASYFLGANNKTYGNMPIVSLISDSSNFFDDEKGIYIAGNTRTRYVNSHVFQQGSGLKFTISGVTQGYYTLSINTVNATTRSAFQTYVDNVAIGNIVDTSVGTGVLLNEIGSFTKTDDSDLVISTDITTKNSNSIYINSIVLTDSEDNQVTYQAIDCSPVGRHSLTEDYSTELSITATVSSVKVIRCFESSDVIFSSPANYNQKGRDWERECSFEFFENDGTLVNTQDCGVRISGSYSRINNPKSLRVIARKDYGKKNFNYSFFNNAYDKNGNLINQYKSLVLRNGGNDCGDTKFTDSYYQKLMGDRTKVEMQSNRAVMVYLDGEFWGLYYIYSDYCAEYFENKYDVDSDNVVMYKNGGIEEGEDEDAALFDEMYNYIMNNDMSVAANYQKACEYMDVDSYINYIAVQFALANGDWPKNNYALWRTRNVEEGNAYGDCRWRFILFDTDRCGSPWGDEKYNSNRFNTLYSKITDTTILTNMAVNLRKNTEFAKKFSLTFQDIINVNLDNYMADTLLNEYNDYLITDGRLSYHWKACGGNLATYNKRYSYIKEFIDGRKCYIAKSSGCGPVHPVTISSNYANAGLIKINSSTIDLTKCKFNEFCGKYGENYAISITAIPKEGYEFVKWDGKAINNPTSSTISVGVGSEKNIVAIYQKVNGVYINEICTSNEGNNCNAKNGYTLEGKYCDWIELYNSTENDIDLSSWGISDSEDSFKTTIASGTTILAGKFLLIYCSKEAIINTKYLVVPINLSKDGETITLTSPEESWSDKVCVPELETDTTYARKTDGDNVWRINYPTACKTNNFATPLISEKEQSIKPIYNTYTDKYYKFTTLENFENCTPVLKQDSTKVVEDGAVQQYLASNNNATLSHNTISDECVNLETGSTKSLKFTGSAGWETYCFSVPLTQEQVQSSVGMRIWVKASLDHMRTTSFSFYLNKTTYKTYIYTDTDIPVLNSDDGQWVYIIWSDPSTTVWQNSFFPEEHKSEILQAGFNIAPLSKSVVYLDDFQLIQKDCLYGDANADEVVDAKDVLEVRKSISGYNNTIDTVLADADCDGKITIKDLYYIRYYLGFNKKAW